VRAFNLPCLVIDEGKNFIEEFLAAVTEKLIVGHGDLHTIRRNKQILDPLIKAFNAIISKEGALHHQGISSYVELSKKSLQPIVLTESPYFSPQAEIVGAVRNFRSANQNEQRYYDCAPDEGDVPAQRSFRS